MIRPPEKKITITHETVRAAVDYVHRCQVLDLIHQWMAADEPRGAQPPAYSVLACLAGLRLLVDTNQPWSWKDLLQLFWYQLEPQSVSLLGLDRTVDPDRRARISRPATQWDRDAQRLLDSEYQRLYGSLDRMFNTIRYSGLARTRKPTNGELKRLQATVTPAQQAVLDERRARHDMLLNLLVRGSVDPALLHDYLGDIVFDEVVVKVAQAGGDTGVREDKRHPGALDAGYWPNKKKMDAPVWGLGGTFVMSCDRPGRNRVPRLVLGIALAKPTGGAAVDALLALDFAMSSGLIPPRPGPRGRERARYAIADLGFTRKNGLGAALLERGFYWIQEYHPNDGTRHTLSNGAILFNGVPVCPGMKELTRTPLQSLPDDATPAHRARHRAREALLLAGRMVPNGRPVPAIKTGPGRPRKDTPPLDEHRVELFCPAAVGNIACPIVAESLTLGDNIPLVPNPPQVANSSQAPRACRSAMSSVLLDRIQTKQYQPHMAGSRHHQQWFGHFRANNEQWHSQLRADQTGGLGKKYFNGRGGERIGLFIALSVASTNTHMQRAFQRRQSLRRPTPGPTADDPGTDAA